MGIVVTSGKPTWCKRCGFESCSRHSISHFHHIHDTNVEHYHILELLLPPITYTTLQTHSPVILIVVALLRATRMSDWGHIDWWWCPCLSRISRLELGSGGRVPFVVVTLHAQCNLHLSLPVSCMYYLHEADSTCMYSATCREPHCVTGLLRVICFLLTRRGNIMTWPDL